MNPFGAFPGLKLNGVFHSKASIQEGISSDSPFENTVRAFAADLFDPDAECSVQTSGSTGPPKTQTFPKTAFLESAQATNRFFGLDANSRAALVLPMRYIAGKMMVARAIAGQWDLVTAEPSGNPMETLDVKGLDFIAITPFQGQNMLERNPAKFRSIGSVLIGGGAISHTLRSALRTAQIPAYASFGMTETLSHFALADLGASDEKPIYEPLENVEIRMDDEGALLVKWPQVTGGWIATNDLVKLHPKGFEWLGRRDHLINSGGVKVIPELVEERLVHLVSVPYFVAGIPDPALGHVPALFLEQHPDERSLEDVELLFKDQPYWKPRKIISRPAFLYTESGKIRRKATIDSWLKDQ